MVSLLLGSVTAAVAAMQQQRQRGYAGGAEKTQSIRAGLGVQQCADARQEIGIGSTCECLQQGLPTATFAAQPSRFTFDEGVAVILGLWL